MEFLDWLAQSPIGQVVKGNTLVYYGMLSTHAVGMAAVVGVVFMLSARVFGFSRDLPLAQFGRLYQIAWVGFTLNLLSGLALFASNGRHLIENTPFLLKLTFIALGGLSLWALTRSITEQSAQLQSGGQLSIGAKGLAFITFSLWTAAIVCGRIIAYTIKYF
jgi:hypothetical protein